MISLVPLMGLAYFLGMSYSIPYFHIRKSIIWPIVIIVSCRAILFNIIAFKYLTNSWPDVFIKNWIVFQVLHVTAIAIFKDIPDLEADVKFHRHTMAAMLGKRQSKVVSVGLLICAIVTLQPAGLFVAIVLSMYLVRQVFWQKELDEYQRYKVSFY
jgi:homogentisate phytyltransferase/homogentisate geranylgeranyltransferase